jgi:nitroreductase
LDALEALHSRTSSPRLTGDVSSEALENILKAALRAPDHAQLRPWRFLLIKGDARKRLGEVFAQADLSENPSQTSQQLEKTRVKPLRAPLIIVGIARVTEHASVPEIEQLISCGAAMQSMLLAAYAQGVGAMWRTGGMAYNPIVHQALELQQNEKIVGYLYMGRTQGKSRIPSELDLGDFSQEWHG